MGKILSLKWVLGVLTSTFITMCIIYLIKRVNDKLPNMGPVSDIIEGV